MKELNWKKIFLSSGVGAFIVGGFFAVWKYSLSTNVVADFKITSFSFRESIFWIFLKVFLLIFMILFVKNKVKNNDNDYLKKSSYKINWENIVLKTSATILIVGWFTYQKMNSPLFILFFTTKDIWYSSIIIFTIIFIFIFKSEWEKGKNKKINIISKNRLTEGVKEVALEYEKKLTIKQIFFFIKLIVAFFVWYFVYNTWGQKVDLNDLTGIPLFDIYWIGYEYEPYMWSFIGILLGLNLIKDWFKLLEIEKKRNQSRNKDEIS